MTEHIERCVARFNECRVDGELEFRAGCLEDGHFSAGVSKDVFDSLERDMLDSSLEAEPSWTEIVDYFYSDPRNIRTRVEYDRIDMKMKRTHVQKETLSSLMITRDDDPREAARLTVCSEHPIKDPPSHCIITYVRIKQRRRFTDVRCGNVIWNFELSKTWSANTREGVEYQQHTHEPTYEVECEFVDVDSSYRKERSNAEIAESILMKLKLILGEETDGRVSVTDELQRRRRGRKRQNEAIDADPLQ